jgi:DNA-binding Lrp family transcriptional regulator
MTDQALVERVGGLMSPSGARTRRRELVDLGFVEDTGMRIKLRSGRLSAVWKAVAR